MISLPKYILMSCGALLFFVLLFKVDGAEESAKSGENKATSKFQSIGVQVEEEKW